VGAGLALALILATSARALPPAQLHDIPAGSNTLIIEDALPLKAARAHIRSGRSDLALTDLSAGSKIFADRVALLRGMALEARKDLNGAKGAYTDALQASAHDSVREAALRGLISVSRKLGDTEAELDNLEALSRVARDEPDPAIEVSRIAALIKLRRLDDAKQRAWAHIDAYPSDRSVDSAERLLLQIDHRHKLSKDERARRDLARARHLCRTGQKGRALDALERVKSALPAKANAIDLDIADLLSKRGMKSRAESTLEHMLARTNLGDLRPDVLLRLARLYADRYQYAHARSLFAELLEQYPRSAAATTGALEAAQLEFDAGALGLASTKMRAIADVSSDGPMGARAMWMAAWSAYLNGTSSTAVELFGRIIRVDPAADPELRDRATYWLGRTFEREGRSEDAIDVYGALAARAPLRYYGLFARARLDLIGKPLDLQILDDPVPPSSVEELVSMLGASRPVNVDRAIALFRAEMRPEAVEELLASVARYRRAEDKRNVALTIDLFRMFERDAWSAVLSRSITDETRMQPGDEPYLWRVWRCAYPTPFRPDVDRSAHDHKLDPMLTYTIMRAESRFRPEAASPVGARGLMQIMPATARWIGSLNPKARPHAAHYKQAGDNIWLGSWYIRRLLDRYKGNLVSLFGAYNAGPSAMDRWRARFGDLDVDELAERTPYFETRNYIRRTLEGYMIYHELYDRGGKRGTRLAEISPVLD
jgi:soluble lytic murein transglycosylase-like protein/predicted negative regulator of RcsB-dependent stress response